LRLDKIRMKKEDKKKKRKRKSGSPKKKKETAIQEIVNHYFFTKGLSLDQIKDDAKKQKIIYSRFTRPAKQLLELSGRSKKPRKR